MHFPTLPLFHGIAIGMLVGCAPAASAGSAASRFELANGLQVILRPVNGAPHVAVVTLFSIGGDHDPEGASGLAHFVEHVYTTAEAGGLAGRSTEEFMRSYPNGWNAQTGDDYTVFATVVDASTLGAEIDHHAARMGELRISEVDLRRELPRIEHELANMYGGIPAIAAANLARERVRPTPLDGRKGGRIEHLERVTLQRLQSRWRLYYKPANATLLIAGRFDLEAIRPVVETAFAKIPPGDEVAAAHPTRTSDDLTDVHTVTLQPFQPGLASTAALAFAAPVPGTPDYAPFLLIVNRLLVQSQQAGFPAPPAEPSLRYAFLDDPNVLVVSAELMPGESVEQIAARLRAFVDQATSSPWQASERAVAKQNLAFFLGTSPQPDGALANNVYGVAFGLGRIDQLGLSGKSLSKKLDRVTAAAVKRVAEKYFSSARGAVAAVQVKDR